MTNKHRERNMAFGAFEFFMEAIEEDRKNGVYIEPQKNLIDSLVEIQNIILKENGIEPPTDDERKLEYMETVDFWKNQVEDEEE